MNQISNEIEVSNTYDKIITLHNRHTKRELNLHLKINGEKIVATQLQGKFCNHLYYEKSIEKNPWSQSIKIVTDFSTSYPMHYQLVLAETIEKLVSDYEGIPIRAKYIRSIILELERIICHLDDLTILGLGLSYSIFYTRMMNLKHEVTDYLNLITKNNTKSFITIGGITNDINNEMSDSFRLLQKLIIKKINLTTRDFQKNFILKGILKNVGFIPRDSAKNLSLVGPLARSSGITHDVRKTDPYCAYGDIDFIVPISDFCDLYGEYIIKTEEIIQSLNIIEQLLNNIPEGEFSIDMNNLELKSNSIITRVESPSGELFTFTQSKNGSIQELPRLFKITSPMQINTQGILSRISGEQITNIEPILLSIGEGWY